MNIAAFHVFLAPSPVMVAFLLATEIYLAWSYRAAFRGVLAAKTSRTAAGSLLPREPVAVTE